MCDLTVTELIQEVLRNYHPKQVDTLGDFFTDLKKELLDGYTGTVEFAEAVNVMDEAVQTS